jgi:hypothetical protein
LPPLVGHTSARPTRLTRQGEDGAEAGRHGV